MNNYNTKPVYWEKAKNYLSNNDNIIKKIIQSVDNKHFLTRNSTPFQTLANAIIGQQISVAAASSVLNKLKSNIGGLSPKKLYSANNSMLTNSGLSRQKIEYLSILASKFVTNPDYFYGFKNMSDKDIIDKLCELKGIGEWTAQMYLIFQLNRPDILPLADIGFVNSAVKIYDIKEPKLQNLLEVSKKWGHYKTVAVWYIWRIIDPEVVQY
ncbi:MAG: DNA-3-methyladenine glycosylase 2 family protein [Gammaproteobacteria bacterium]|jgi:DNA-3-methyladenine glycosylase II|nr:DNA-3-methyladenine glycosylase 2 family protein [Gammaproteobacteria bacterium]MBT4461968.1 DNA-3-methyladenine glycosylase 2 family protein [Gammaproteobacteria bacterium]MBT4655169.1 DNA-3-methyladenine glycosylase 2 family protein [Gammaproteobacteria bacterium]MBT5116386.1 DNA-3-methyladenine glycosylase 2 family protein [Gammaproteobacteria bacterium]MBT5761421.1 DNA-3-methyladenine glycosylase 2 family protein [Gammaproteobacteria bacterium]